VTILGRVLPLVMRMAEKKEVNSCEHGGVGGHRIYLSEVVVRLSPKYKLGITLGTVCTCTNKRKCLVYVGLHHEKSAGGLARCYVRCPEMPGAVCVQRHRIGSKALLHV
jgi:hypothetical protein